MPVPNDCFLVYNVVWDPPKMIMSSRAQAVLRSQDINTFHSRDWAQDAQILLKWPLECWFPLSLKLNLPCSKCWNTVHIESFLLLFAQGDRIVLRSVFLLKFGTATDFFPRVRYIIALHTSSMESAFINHGHAWLIAVLVNWPLGFEVTTTKFPLRISKHTRVFSVSTS